MENIIGNIYLDIETGPDPRPGAIASYIDQVKPPGSYKKPESIQKWMDENAEAKAQELWQKTSLNAALGYIACIGYAIDDDEPVSLTASPDQEDHLLVSFFRVIESAVIAANSQLTIIGHNVQDFDLKFIWQRAMINRVKPPKQFPGFFGKGETYVYDTMKMWAGFRDRISQDDLCKALGIPGKPDTGPTGATVWEYLLAGKIREIQDYNCDDIEKVRMIHKRMTFQ